MLFKNHISKGELFMLDSFNYYEPMTQPQNKPLTSLIPYIVTIVGSVIAIAANFIQYVTISNWLFSRKISIFSLITESLNDPDNMLQGTGDKVFFYAIIAGIGLSIMTALFAVLKRMKATIAFAVIASLPFLIMSKAYIHYAGFAITVIGAIWYLIVNRKQYP